MEILYYYALFALSGALTSMITIWYPAHQVAKMVDPTNICVIYKKLYYALCFSFSIIIAPALIIVFMNSEQFIKTFVESLLGREDEN